MWVMAGQVARIRMIGGKQVATMTFVGRGADAAGFSDKVTAQLGTRSLRVADRLYSGPPTFTHLASVVHDPVGVHFLRGPCSTTLNRLGGSDHVGCYELLGDALGQIGVAAGDVPFAALNAFLRADVAADGTYALRAPVAEPGDVLELRAEVDLAVGVAACAHRYGDLGPIGALQFEVLDP